MWVISNRIKYSINTAFLPVAKINKSISTDFPQPLVTDAEVMGNLVLYHMFDFRQYFLLITAFLLRLFFEKSLFYPAAPSRNLSCGGSAALPRKDQAASGWLLTRFPQLCGCRLAAHQHLDIVHRSRNSCGRLFTTLSTNLQIFLYPSSAPPESTYFVLYYLRLLIFTKYRTRDILQI